MLYKLTGDVLRSSAAAVAHGVSPDDHFDQGLALALRERWPAMYKDFRHYSHTSGPQPGGLWSWAGADGRRIVALFTQADVQQHGRRKATASVEHVNHSLRALRRLVEEEHIDSLALPRLATGVGGLQWTEVEPLIEQRLGDLDIPVYVYAQYQPGVAAVEP
ncbi:MAG: macro domain-containing protein [Acidimicrobiia bacterium]|nr:macro domain-containing protein [Acidimicrobiia bacterium]